MEILLSKSPGLVFEEQIPARPAMTAEDYLQRVELLQERMKKLALDYVVIYGDREHFSNIEYFSSYDCRFEEALWVLSQDGTKSVIVGNEGYGYSFQIPYPVNRYLYQNFSLQGQPREKSKSLHEILSEIGITAGSKVGVVGVKYFDERYFDNPQKLFDIPEYILGELRMVNTSFINITQEITGLPDGIRMKIHNVKEIAWGEYVAVKSAAVVRNLLRGMEPGIQELELSRKGNIDFMPVTMYSLVNFGEEHIALGLRSPDDTVLEETMPYGVCYSLRGSLCSRTGLALSGANPEYDEVIENFYKPYWSAIATWYENVKVGAVAGKVYDKVMHIIGDERFGVTLNPGHNTGMDEWTNSPFFENSQLTIPSGTYLQCDIIGTNQKPYCTAICEDTVVVADEAMRQELKEKHPETFERIVKRQEMMRSELGIQVDDSLLPLSNLNGVYFPYGLDCTTVFTKK